jgi:hypothetical protein
MSATAAWLLELERLSYRLKRPPPPEPEPRPRFVPDERRQTVVGRGRIHRDPVNREAAVLLSKAAWIYHPPQHPHYEKTKTDTAQSAQRPTNKTRSKKTPYPNQKNRRKKQQMRGVEHEGIPTTRLVGGLDQLGGNTGIPKGTNPQEYVNIDEIVASVIARINKQPHQLTELARAAIDARNVLRENDRELAQGMEKFNAKAKVALEDFRQVRMSYVMEASQILKPLKEIREFFLGPTYTQEIERLRSFVELCERLAQLKKDGTLDAIGDTIIRLAVT